MARPVPRRSRPPSRRLSRCGVAGHRCQPGGQYNNIIAQITTTAQDSSFNGINLLNGDTLKLIFNETGKSTLSITGVTFNAAGLGLASLTAGTDFLDNSSAKAS